MSHDLNLDKLLIQSPKLGTSNPPQSPPLPSTPSAPQLNDDIKARILAFQQKRTKPFNGAGDAPSPPSLSPKLPPIHSHHGTSFDLGIPNKPLPPLPASNHRSLSANDTAPKELIPSPNIPEHSIDSTLNDRPPLPKLTNISGILGASTKGQNISPLGQNPPFELSKKKPSLSERRGMKLNVDDMNKQSPLTSPLQLSPTINESETTKSTVSRGNFGQEYPLPNSPRLNPAGGLSRRLSERKNKTSFKLNLDASNSDLPQHQNANVNPDLSKNNNSDPSGPNSQQNDASTKPQLQGLFANYSKYVDIKSGQLNFAGKASLHSKGVDFLSGSSFRISLEELEYIEELGHGNYGSVLKVLHKPTGVLMAMKEVRLELDETKFTQILMELEILHKCDSPYIVDFYGAFFVEGAVYMCMEYMDGGSLDKVYGKDDGVQDEACLAYIADCVIQGLKELKDKHNIIHRDVKPTNILVNTLGKVKLCDFGVSGNLVASLAKTNIGCQSYMAPERIKTLNPDDATYSVQSDIWSLGLTILEVAAGHYPYPAETYGNIFSQLSAIVDGDPPTLDSSTYSKEARMFVKSCLNKNPDLRPSYAALLSNPWLTKHRGVNPRMDILVKEHLERAEAKSVTRSSSTKSTKGPNVRVASVAPMPPNIESVHSLLKNKVKAPALHRGGLPNNNRNFLNNR